jgi:uncharacterized Ntn-hydrolase superfamily protein
MLHTCRALPIRAERYLVKPIRERNPRAMTWSIVARDASTGAFGVAVTTKAFAVGALCPWVSSGVGAVSTQALVNQTYGPRGLRLLGEGVPADDVLRLLLAADDGRDHRQVHAIDAAGRIAQHTGVACGDWAGHLAEPSRHVSVAGNLLAGPQVVADTLATYLDNLDRPFGERMMLALEAGQRAGGDRRGRQSAAMRIHTTEEYADLDLRVDDHEVPLVELRRLWEMSQGRPKIFRSFLATKANPAGVFDRAVIDAAIAEWEAAQAAAAK